MNPTEELRSFQDKLEIAKSKRDQLTGSYNSVMKRILDDFGAKSIEVGKKKLLQLDKKAEDLKSEFDKLRTSLKEKYDW